MIKKLLDKRLNPMFAVLMVFLLGFFLVNDLGLRYIVVYALLVLVLAAGIFMAGIYRPGMKLGETLGGIWKRVTPMKACYIFMAAVVTVFSVMPNSNWGHLVMSLTISMLVFTAYLLFMQPSERGVSRAFVAVHVMAILFAVYIFAVKLWPDFYWDMVYPYLGSYVQEQADLLLPLGYGVPLGGSATYADYVMAIALFANMGDVFIGNGLEKNKKIPFIAISSSLYIVAILLMNRRSEVLAIGAAGLIMIILHLKSAGKKDNIRRLSTLAATLVLTILILIPLARAGYMNRYISMLDAVIPGDFSISSLFEKKDTDTDLQQNEEPNVTPSAAPSVEPTAEPVITPEEKPAANEISGGRLALWEKAFALFKEKPVFGIGWEQFMNYNTYEHDVHNTYLQWLCEAGLVGFFLLMTPMMFMFFMTFKRTIWYRRKGKDAPLSLKKMNYVSLSMQMFFLALNLIDPAFYHLNFFCFFTFTIGLEEASRYLGEQPCTRSDSKCLIKSIWENAKLF